MAEEKKENETLKVFELSPSWKGITGPLISTKLGFMNIFYESSEDIGNFISTLSKR